MCLEYREGSEKKTDTSFRNYRITIIESFVRSEYLGELKANYAHDELLDIFAFEFP